MPGSHVHIVSGIVRDVASDTTVMSDKLSADADRAACDAGPCYLKLKVEIQQAVRVPLRTLVDMLLLQVPHDTQEKQSLKTVWGRSDCMW